MEHNQGFNLSKQQITESKTKLDVLNKTNESMVIEHKEYDTR